MTSPRVCELCDREASVYCASDAAFLCSECDGRVHGANFLVARHLRHRLCSQCQGLAAADAGNRNPRPICNSCSPETFSGDGGDTSSESSEASSACISSTESFGTKSGFENRRKSESSVTEVSGKVSDTPARSAGRFTSAIKKKRNRVQRTEVRAWRDAKAEGTFVIWCNKLGLNGNLTAAVVSSASKALTFCLGRLTGVPLRVSLAASFWFGLRLCGDRALPTCQNLRRVEEATGVPAKLILAVEARLGRELRIRHARRDDLEEGWAEC